jgi:hypothetical protein
MGGALHQGPPKSGVPFGVSKLVREISMWRMEQEFKENE